MTNSEIEELLVLEHLMSKERGQNDFVSFSRSVMPDIEMTPFHRAYYKVLEMFAKGEIKKLIVTVPPQHGKSLGSTTLLPAYLLGINPDMRIAIASYSASLASKFNRRVQRIIDSADYEYIFPETAIKKAGKQGSYMRTSTEAEIVGRNGSLLSVGREGALTGNRVDCFILDDLYKDAMEANSPLIRENCIEWYTSVAKTRMHNDSSELIVFTRWHEEDLIGHLIEKEPYTIIKSYKDLENSQGWMYLNFEAIKTTPPTDIDPREIGDALWESRQSVSYLLEKRNLDVHKFECMYQGSPSSREGLLYGDNFNTYTTLPPDDQIVGRLNYTDTADMGEDYLCSVCYVKTKENQLFVTDIVFTQKPMEYTEPLVAEMLRKNDTRTARIESNNGGRGFARVVQKIAPMVKIENFTQSSNKESRILTNSATVLQLLFFPLDWATRWSEFYYILTRYKRVYKANKWHDAADVVTGIIEEETRKKGRIKRIF